MNSIDKNKYKEIVDIYNQGKSTIKIANMYKVSPATIRNILIRSNVSLRSRETYRKYALNANFFDTIDNELKAYWLGFIIGDGHNNINNNTIEINLKNQEGEEELLNQLHTDMFSNSPIRTIMKNRKGQIRSLICSKHLSQILQSKYNLYNNKSETATFPEKQVSEHLWMHLIRGIFDSDGSIFFKQNSNGSLQSPVFSICGTFKLVESIQKILMSKLILPKTKIEVASEGSLLYSFRYQGTQEVLKIRNYLYTNATRFLKRKYDKMFSFESIKKGIIILEEDKENIIDMYISGKSTRYLAMIYNVNKNTITKFLITNKITIRSNKDTKKSIVEAYKDNIILSYSTGESTTTISKKYNISPAVVLKFLKRWGVPIRDAHYSPLKDKKKEILKMRKSGMSMQAIANIVHCNKNAILHFLNKLS